MIAAVSVSYTAGRGRKDPSNEQVPALVQQLQQKYKPVCGRPSHGKKIPNTYYPKQ
jgi:hypothetical protein